MKQDNSKQNEDQHQPKDSQSASRHEFLLEVNGITITVSSETGMVTARELLKSAEKAKAW